MEEGQDEMWTENSESNDDPCYCKHTDESGSVENVMMKIEGRVFLSVHQIYAKMAECVAKNVHKQEGEYGGQR